MRVSNVSNNNYNSKKNVNFNANLRNCVADFSSGLLDSMIEAAAKQPEGEIIVTQEFPQSVLGGVTRCIDFSYFKPGSKKKPDVSDFRFFTVEGTGRTERNNFVGISKGMFVDSFEKSVLECLNEFGELVKGAQ